MSGRLYIDPAKRAAKRAARRAAEARGAQTTPRTHRMSRSQASHASSRADIKRAREGERALGIEPRG